MSRRYYYKNSYLHRDVGVLRNSQTFDPSYPSVREDCAIASNTSPTPMYLDYPYKKKGKSSPGKPGYETTW
jgi:hypothetical protein